LTHKKYFSVYFFGFKIHFQPFKLQTYKYLAVIQIAFYFNDLVVYFANPLFNWKLVVNQTTFTSQYY